MTHFRRRKRWADGGDRGTGSPAIPLLTRAPLPIQSAVVAAAHQHYFDNATATLAIGTGDVLYAYVYLNPANLPTGSDAAMERWTWEHRVIGREQPWLGVDGTAAGVIWTAPGRGPWVQLESASQPGESRSSTVKGMAFTLWTGAPPGMLRAAQSVFRQLVRGHGQCDG